MNRTTTITTGRHVKALFVSRNDRLHHSALLETVCDRYTDIINRYTPPLSDDEWEDITQPLNHTNTKDTSLIMAALEQIIYDYGCEALSDKLERLSWIEKLAVIDVVERLR